MVVEAFMYMYVVGLGTALGVATVAFIGWKVVKRSGTKRDKKRRVAAR